MIPSTAELRIVSPEFPRIRDLHESVVAAAVAEGKSLNQWVADELRACIPGG